MGEGIKKAKKAAKATRKSGLEVVYGVPWIEVEFGQRPEGWALYMEKAACFRATKAASAKGSGGGGYLGPERPLTAFEIPFESLDEKYRTALRKDGKVHTDDHWGPKFRGERHWIE